MLCEKTMEISVDRCQAMIAAARDAKVQLAIAYRCQFEPHHLECVRLARDGTFGRLLSVEAGFGFPIGGSDQWRLDRERSGRGPLMDVGIYAELDQFGAELDDLPAASGAAARPEFPGRRDCATSGSCWLPTNRRALAQPCAAPAFLAPNPALRPAGCDRKGPSGHRPTSTAAGEILAPGAGLCHDFHP